MTFVLDTKACAKVICGTSPFCQDRQSHNQTKSQGSKHQPLFAPPELSTVSYLLLCNNLQSKNLIVTHYFLLYKIRHNHSL